MMFRGYRFELALLFLCFYVSGCGQSGPQVAPVHGKVTLDGKPLRLADVNFQPEGGQRGSSGRTDSDGHYELGYKRGQSGALVGNHTVRISVSPEGTKNPPIIAAQFDTNTQLHREVKSGDNEFDFDVTTEKK
jgi:hypothetical protein